MQMQAPKGKYFFRYENIFLDALEKFDMSDMNSYV